MWLHEGNKDTSIKHYLPIPDNRVEIGIAEQRVLRNTNFLELNFGGLLLINMFYACPNNSSLKVAVEKKEKWTCWISFHPPHAAYTIHAAFPKYLINTSAQNKLGCQLHGC